MNDSLDNLPTIDPGFEPSAAELKEGQFLGENQNYRLEKNLGVGGMGEVWLAAEIRAGQEIRKVVVKTLRPDRRGNEGAQEKALEQFKLIQKLNHQNICPIYVIEKDPACGYLVVMGYAGGGSYADWFAGKPKPLAEVCKILRPIADALDFAHSKGVIHRDVKPSNMMFTSDKTPWLIDFGIAANLRTATQATTGQFSQSGTDSYMAPEQKSGQLQTEQTDEYSLALVVLEFLTGMPFLQAIQKLPLEIQPILNKALALEPSDRYATCRAFIDALTGTTHLASSNKPSTQSSSDDAGSVVPAGAKTAIDQIVEAERLAAEAKRRAEEEALQKKIQDLDKQVAEEYQSARYAEAIDHLNEILQLKPDHENAKWLLNSATQKLEIQKKEEAERKAREEAERKAREEAERKAREEAERKARAEAERKAREEAERKEREETARKAREEAERKAREEAERKAREEVERKAKEEAARKAREEAEEKRRQVEEAFRSKGFEVEGTILKKYTGRETIVEIPKGITKIEGGAFARCRSLISVVIPKGVTEIGKSAFFFCTSLTSVVIPKGVTKIEDGTFHKCSSLVSVVIPEGVWKIGMYAFTDCGSLTSVVFPEGLTVIGYGAFIGCRALTSVVIPDSVKVIEGRAFEGCIAIKEWQISSTHSYFKRDGVGLLTKDGKKLVACLASAKKYWIPQGVTEIGRHACSGCSSLTSVVVPDGVTVSGGHAFSGCSSLTSMAIPRSVKTIEVVAFENCPKLKIEAPIFSYAWWWSRRNLTQK